MTARTALVIVATLAAGYLGTCWIWPYKNCRTCRGQGTLRGFPGIRHCPACEATGLRLRAGRRLIDTAHRHRHNRHR